jgi:hypothetical protein
MKHTCGTPLASSRLYFPHIRYTLSRSSSLEHWIRKYPALMLNIFDSSCSYGTSLECTLSQSPPGHVCRPMFTRSAALNRSSTRLLSSMNSSSMSLPVHGLRESFLFASRPSVKSTDTRTAPAAKHRRMSFSHSSHRSARNCSREYPGSSASSGYSNISIDGAITACLTACVAIARFFSTNSDANVL